MKLKYRGRQENALWFVTRINVTCVTMNHRPKKGKESVTGRANFHYKGKPRGENLGSVSPRVCKAIAEFCPVSRERLIPNSLFMGRQNSPQTKVTKLSPPLATTTGPLSYTVTLLTPSARVPPYRRTFIPS